MLYWPAKKDVLEVSMAQSLSAAWARLLVWLVLFAGLITPSTALNAETPAKTAQAPAGKPDNKPLPQASSAPKTVDDLKTIQARVEQVVQKVMPAVVGIVIRNSQGSGVVVSKDGYVLTAGHVAAEPNIDVTLIFPDGRHVKAKTLGVNHGIDAGMIKITEKGDWPFVEMGKASTLKVGQWCLAMGHPGGYRRDRTPPVRLGRILVNASNVIVTSCTLMGGDSGGPLFDLDGKVIGIHSRIGQSTTANMHVPVDTFTQTWDRLAKGEDWGMRPAYTGGPMLGVETEETPAGCLVKTVIEGTAAQKAGIKPGDLIQKFDRQEVKGPQELADLILKHVPNDQITLELLRDGKSIGLSVKLGTRP
jgi:serine protease Do